MFCTFHNFHGHEALLPARPQEAVTKLIGIIWARHTNTAVCPHTTSKHTGVLFTTFFLGHVMQFCKLMHKSVRKKTKAKNKLTGCPRPATQWRSVPSPPCGSHDTFHWRDLRSSHGDNHLPSDDKVSVITKNFPQFILKIKFFEAQQLFNSLEYLTLGEKKCWITSLFFY